MKKRPSTIDHRPLVSVIVVSYNTKELTLRSVESVQASQGFKKGEIEVIVVDNGSTDDSVNYLGSHLEQFRLIVNSANKGFGAANNQGSSIALGQYLLFLNSDAFLARDTLRTLVDTLITRKEIYSTGPQLLYADARLQPSCGYFPTPGRVVAWMWGLDKLPVIKLFFPYPYHIYDLSWYQRQQYPDWLMGACILFRASEFRSVKGFDESIFMYSEEVDLYQRLFTKLNKKVFFNPVAQTVHLGSASTAIAQSSRLVSELKGIVYFYTQHNQRLVWLIRFVIYTGVMLRIAIFSLLPSRRLAVLEYKKFFKS